MAIICANCGHRNPDGSRFCANPECGAFLAWTEQNAGPQGPPPSPEPSAGPPRQSDATRWGYGDGGQTDVAASMSLSESTLTVPPGETATITVSVHNGGTQVEQFAVAVLGPTAEWADIDPPVLVVYPDARAEAVIRWSPPRQPSTAAGRAPFTIRAASILHRGLQVHATGVLDVGEFRELTGTLTPQTTTGRWQTRHRIELTNAGNVVEAVQLKATDPAGRIRFSLPSAEISLPPGSQGMNMTVRPPVRFLGRPASQPFQVLATPRPPLPPVRLDGTREIVPLIAGWVPKVVAGLVAAGVAAAALLITKPFAKEQPSGAATPVGGTATTTAPVHPTRPTGTPGASPTGGSGASASPPSSSPSSALPINSPWVVVDGSGTMQFTNGAVAVNPLAPGRNEVTFTRNVANCVYVATVAASGGQPVPDRGLVFTARGSNPNSVVVETRDLNNALHQYPFHLQVRCSSGQSAVVANGGVSRGNDQPFATRTGDGQWEVRFGHDVRACAYVATIGSADAAGAPIGLINVGSGQKTADAVFVQTWNSDGSAADLPFHLQTRCRSTFAVVTADGQATRKEGVRSVTPGTDPGTYEVKFKQDVSKCSYVAAIGDADGTPVDPDGEVFVASGPKPTLVEVQTRKLNLTTGVGDLTNYPFHLQVDC